MGHSGKDSSNKNIFWSTETYRSSYSGRNILKDRLVSNTALDIGIFKSEGNYSIWIYLDQLPQERCIYTFFFFFWKGLWCFQGLSECRGTWLPWHSKSSGAEWVCLDNLGSESKTHVHSIVHYLSLCALPLMCSEVCTWMKLPAGLVRFLPKQWAMDVHTHARAHTKKKKKALSWPDN